MALRTGSRARLEVLGLVQRFRDRPHMIVATAGHIDHGKTALVKALTGIDADRLPEEKARGITVDLGFAYATSASGHALGFVDVPGHEKLVRAMLAGATGVDFVILVIAADDGIKPQTREHLAILDLLGLRRGLVALTKIDRVDSNRLAIVEAEIEAFLEGSVLEGAPILPCSAHRGDGVDALAARLDAEALGSIARANTGRFRLAIDRAFTLDGAGLVVTGAVHAGSVTVGDRLMIAPLGREVRVRSLRVQNKTAATGQTGDRCALNITGPRVEKADIARGDWIIASGRAAALTASRIDVFLRLLPSEAKALRHWTPVHVHIGAADIPGRVALLEGTALEPGASTLAQLILDTPTAALCGDRFVLRDQSARRTLGGGRVLDPRSPSRNNRKPERLAFLRALDQADSADALDTLTLVAENGVDFDHFIDIRNLDEGAAQALATARDLVVAETQGGRLLFSAARWAALRAETLSTLTAYQAAHPDSFGATIAELTRQSPAVKRPAMTAALDALIADKAVTRLGQILHLPGHSVKLSLEEDNLWHEIRTMMDGAGLDQPRLSFIAERLRLTEAEIAPLLEKLALMGELRRVSKVYFMQPGVVARLAEAARLCGTTHPEALLTVGQFREATGVGRHVTMPILEFFDRVGYTSRHRDGRRLRCEPGVIFTETERAQSAIA